MLELNGKQYDLGKLNARQQFHLVRKLAPLFAPSEEGKFLEHLAFKLAEMPQADVDYILTLCLSTVKRLEGKDWAYVQAPNTDTLMFADIDMPAMIRLTVAVVEANLGSFLDLSLLPSSEAVPVPRPVQ